MNEDPSIRFTGDTEAAERSAEALLNAPVAADAQIDGRTYHAAKTMAAFLGLMLIVVLPMGAYMSDHGILTPSLKRSLPIENHRNDTKPTPSVRLSPSQGNPYQAPDVPAPGAMNNGRSGTVPNAGSTIPSTMSGRGDLSPLVLQVSQSVREYAMNCRRNGGSIRSGAGGESLCSVINDHFMLPWPALPVCGSASADTKWTVFRGDTDTWDITITCAGRHECDGPSNALCTKNGCTFSETCLPTSGSSDRGGGEEGDFSMTMEAASKTAQNYAWRCHRYGGMIRSGSGGDMLCIGKDFLLPWPTISDCGSDPADTKWIVSRGDTDAWDIAITCAGRHECDGPSNAHCTAGGCTFSEACMPK